MALLLKPAAILVVVLVTVKCDNPDGKKFLHLMNLMPMSGTVWYGGGACLPAIEMALRHINERADILPEYYLQQHLRDSHCNAGWALNHMYDQLYKAPTKIMIIGPGCSTEAEATAQASHLWNITHLSWAASSVILSDKARFPRFYRLTAPDTMTNVAKVALMEHFNWQKVASISTAQEVFSSVTDDFVQQIRGTNITVITEEIFNTNNDPTSRLLNMKKQDARIIITAQYEDVARRLLCAAYRVGLYGPKIVWIFIGWYKDNWWRDHREPLPCSKTQMDKAAEGHLLTGMDYNNPPPIRGIANLTNGEFFELFWQEPSYNPDLKDFEFITGVCYDTIWAAALALQCADTRLKEIGHPQTLDQCSYNDSVMYDVITNCTSQLSFRGVTGEIIFGVNGDPVRNVKIDQVQDARKVEVGTYISIQEPRELKWKNGGIRWPSGTAPRDSTLVTEKEQTIPAFLYSVFSCMAAAGIMVAVSFLVFNVIYRQNTFVKLSSPNINNVLLTGCIVTYSHVFMHSLDQETPFLCNLRTFTFTIGFTMAFGALFSKTWRVYKIFANKKLLRLKIHDLQLVGLVAMMLGLVTTLLIIWEIIDPQVIQIVYLGKEVYLTGNDAEVHPFIRMCVSEYDSYFSWTLTAIEGVMLAFGAFLAFETRKVKIPALNDSRLIGMCLYNVVVLAALGLTLSLVLRDQVALMFGITSGFIILGTTTTQLIVFVPKVAMVFWPHRIEVDETATLNGTRLGVSTVQSSKRRLEPRDPSAVPSSSCV